MKRVRRRKTDLEERVARALRQLGRGYRRNVSSLPGSPDFANRTRGWALFVNGCFWHHHRNCPLATVPAANREFWVRKFRDNRNRDARKLRELRRIGLRVGILWQCQVEDPATLEAKLRRFFGGHARASVPGRRRASRGGGRASDGGGPISRVAPATVPRRRADG